ncbi:DnaB-like helicase C-terminal domain-containing protein [Nitrospirillum iridis]|uniref:Twinkle protein n=1 Tax=Nitrospirillum iridis TaxID=765888 RepID=A0A7X0B156_9PROT|nr:twinkle protein [Nitrospirillum iridis]
MDHEGGTFCFACNKPGRPSGDRPSGGRNISKEVQFVSGEAQALVKRGISEDTAKKWRYEVGTDHGKPVQIANYYDKNGALTGQKIRYPDKTFRVVGKLSGLYGQHLWGGGKRIVITEGEIDALSVSQAQNNSWPVVSVPNGAAGAKASIEKALDYLDKFEEIVLAFDNDEPGRKASAECAPLLPPGRVKIAAWPLKDASDLLQAGRVKDLTTAIWNAAPWRPDGIVNAADLWDSIADRTEAFSVPYPWEDLNSVTYGLRVGELVTVTAGSGVGKSAIVREVAHHLLKRGERVGMLMLEESIRRTALGMLGLELNTRLHVSMAGVNDSDLRAAFDRTFSSGNLFLYDHFGSTEIDNLLSRVRYLAHACKCRWIILDHISIVVSGMGDGDERRLIDNAMTALRTLVQELGIGLILVTHLKRPEGKGHEEGALTSLSQLRGSASIAQLSDIVIGAERNQQGDRPNLTTLRVLKNRFSGDTGIGGYLEYHKDTGRLIEADAPDTGDAPPDDSEF